VPASAGWAARIVAVRAMPTIGPSSGRVHTSGLVVKPKPRRSGTSSSSALHTVGVSIDFNSAIRSLVSSNISASYGGIDVVIRERWRWRVELAGSEVGPGLLGEVDP